jgi:hypothetical protein
MARVPIGALNEFDPAPQDRGQPTSFERGTSEGLLTVAYEGATLTWHLDGNLATASSSSPSCEAPPPEPAKTTTIDYTHDALYPVSLRSRGDRLPDGRPPSGRFIPTPA